jgi:UDP-2,3-diacylglucosamine pyrophosphatase LpxH
MSYQDRINAGLDRAYAAAPVVPIELRQLRLVIVSDLHRGAGDDADDFRFSQHALATALGHYRRTGWMLAVLGDSEELWECEPDEVVAEYRASLRLEKPFLDDGRYFRFAGNHDEDWLSAALVEQYLEPILGRVGILQALRLEVMDQRRRLGEVFLVHGHQGTLLGDVYAWVSEAALPVVWRPVQRLFNIKTTLPATDWRLGRKHERAMHNWAVARRGLIVISGHTHHPVFPSPARYEQLSATYDDLRHQPEAYGSEELERLEADLAYAADVEQPCYFNTGCCSFSDGSLTAIEIAGGQMRLVRWRRPEVKPTRQVLASAPLKQVLAEVALAGLPVSTP